MTASKQRVCGVKRTIEGMTVHDGAGVRLNRIIASPQLNHVDPFVLLDEFRSDDPNDYIKGFPWHPHRGIETVTYMVHGRFKHEDSRGGGGTLSSGDVQWMTAGKGILHQEMPGQTDGSMWGYQLWLTLPKADKMVEPRYQHLSSEDIPVVNEGDVEVRIISGEFNGSIGPAQTWFPISYFDVRLPDGAAFHHHPKPGMNFLVYVHTGSVVIGSGDGASEIPMGGLAILDDGIEVHATGGSEKNGFLFLAGKPLNEPIARGGPFVMNTPEEIEQAWKDFYDGNLF